MSLAVRPFRAYNPSCWKLHSSKMSEMFELSVGILTTQKVPGSPLTGIRARPVTAGGFRSGGLRTAWASWSATAMASSLRA